MTFKDALKAVCENEAMWMLEKATGLTVTQLRLLQPDTTLDAEACKSFLHMIEQRKQGTPLQYILGSWDFMGLEIKCEPGVLIPRSETEILAQEVILFVEKLPGVPTILDICTGSGCIGISVAKFCPQSVVTLSDINPQALTLAQQNAGINKVADRLSFVKSDLFKNITGRFNCIIANPPYIPTGEIDSLQEEVKKEPILALDGGVDGLDFYRKIIPSSLDILLPGGSIFLEIGHDQSKAVAEILRLNGFKAIVTIKDLQSRDRVVRGTRAK